MHLTTASYLRKKKKCSSRTPSKNVLPALRDFEGMGGWFTLQSVPIKYDDYCKLVGNTGRYLKTSVTGLLPLQETFLSPEKIKCGVKRDKA